MKWSPDIVWTQTSDGTMSLYELRVIYNQYKDLNIAYYRDLRKNYCMYGGDRQRFIKKWQKNIKSGMSMFFSEAIFSSLLDSDTRYIVAWRKLKDQNTANYILDWLEYLHTRSESDNAFRDAIKDTVILWTWFFKIGYKYSKTPFKYMTKDWKTKDWEEVEDYSTMQYLSPIWVIVDKTARSEDTARYIIERKVMAVETIRDYYSFYNLDITEEIINAAYYIDNIDYERWKNDLFMAGNYYSDKPIRDEVYRFVKEKTCEVFEVYERGMLSIFINWFKYWPFPQIWPWKKCPYRAIQFIRVPNSIYGMWVGLIVKPLQEVFDWILNSRMDNVALVNNKVFIHVTSLDPILTNTDFLELEPWLILHTADKDAISELPMSDVKQWPIIESGNLMQLTEQTLGTNWYSMGVQWKVERSAFGVEALQKAALNRIKGCIKSISKAMWFSAKYQFILSLEYTEEETFKKVLWEEWAALVTAIDIKDAIEDINFDFSMDAMKIQSIATKMQQGIELLQIAPKLVDSAGNALVNLKPVVKYILQGMWIGDDVELTDVDLEEAVAKLQKMKAALETQPQQPQEQSQNPMEKLMTWWGWAQVQQTPVAPSIPTV